LPQRGAAPRDLMGTAEQFSTGVRGCSHRISPRLSAGPGGGWSAALTDPLDEQGDLIVDLSILAHERTDLLNGVHDRRVVPAAEDLGDVREGQLGQLAHDVHADLAGGDE